MSIKPIETYYKGYRFRSRLEARWAVFFDALNIRYNYELQGYNLDGLMYLPDFYLPRYGIFVEIKGYTPNSIELEKAERLCIGTQEGVLIFVGDPYDPIEFYTYMWYPWYGSFANALSYTPASVADNGILGNRELRDDITYINESGFCVGMCGYVRWSLMEDMWFPLCRKNHPPTPIFAIDPEDVSHMRYAQLRARQARFEHGERA